MLQWCCHACHPASCHPCSSCQYCAPVLHGQRIRDSCCKKQQLGLQLSQRLQTNPYDRLQTIATETNQKSSKRIVIDVKKDMSKTMRSSHCKVCSAPHRALVSIQICHKRCSYVIQQGRLVDVTGIVNRCDKSKQTKYYCTPAWLEAIACNDIFLHDRMTHFLLSPLHISNLAIAVGLCCRTVLTA